MKATILTPATLLAMTSLASLASAAALDRRFVAGNEHYHDHLEYTGGDDECIPDRPSTTWVTITVEPTYTAISSESITSSEVSAVDTSVVALSTNSEAPTSTLETSVIAYAPTTSSTSSSSTVESSTTVAAVPTTTASAYLSTSASSATASMASSTATSSSTVPLAWKAGLSGYPGIEILDIFNTSWVPYISWYSNYEPIAPNVDASDHTVIGAPMLWGSGQSCLDGADGPVDEYRMGNFTAYVATGETSPDVFFGFYEPDCDCDASSQIPDVSTGISVWNDHIAPLSSRNIPLGSPSMCKQTAQTWLSDFTPTWDITSIHVNKPTAAGAQEAVNYYWNTFGKPIWITELTCVDDSDWSSCGDQDAVNAFIDEIVPWLESNENVIAYGANNGEGVPGVWNLMSGTGPDTTLTATGEHYQSVLKGLLAKR